MNKKAKEIIIKTKKKIFGTNFGNNSSIFVGNGLDFSEIKEYNIGDDVKKINWKVTAKFQKPYINVFTEEKELNILAIFLVSGNIFFGSIKQKQDLMSEVLALVGYSAIKNSDNFSALFFSQKEEKLFLPTKNMKLLYPIIDYATSLNPLGKEVSFRKLNEFLIRLKQKHIIILIGDFYEDVDLSLVSARHEVYSVIVRDEFEENPRLDSHIFLKDPKTLKEKEFFLDKSVLNEYKRALSQKDKKLYEHFLKNDIAFCKIYTSEDPFFKLSNLFKA
ncbi:MAG: DUF58 domain-containing protein [Epsilonproteobacteria bacterium]|nr:DUF58 domain-containing protein [Campylobacterota bacterium]